MSVMHAHFTGQYTSTIPCKCVFQVYSTYIYNQSAHLMYAYVSDHYRFVIYSYIGDVLNVYETNVA